MKYFAYGSNLCIHRMKRRLGEFPKPINGRVDGYKLMFNKRSKDESGKANLMNNHPGNFVEGRIYELTEKQFIKLKKSEVGYIQVDNITVEVEGKPMSAGTFIADDKNIRNNLTPTNDYFDLIICGAHDDPPLPDSYIYELIKDK